MIPLPDASRKRLTPAQGREAVRRLRTLTNVSECSLIEPADKTCRTANKRSADWCATCAAHAFLERIGEAL